MGLTDRELGAARPRVRPRSAGGPGSRRIFSPRKRDIPEQSRAIEGEIAEDILENGFWTLRLEATDVNGVVSSTEVPISVEGLAKVGVVGLSFLDLNVPVFGVPIRVTRSYDSRVKGSRDFGVGWDLAVTAGKVQHNRVPGLGWVIRESAPPFFFPCREVDELIAHQTKVQLSDREWYAFAPSLVNLSVAGGTCFADVVYNQVDGWSTGATLSVVGNTTVYYSEGEGGVVDDQSFALFNPSDFVLTTPDGREVEVERGVGITRIKDRFEDELFIGHDGITSSSGVSIAFERDAEGRITKITDPTGAELHYGYDARGDLVSFEDQTSNRTSFTYDSDHNLVDLYDPLGFRGIRNEYDAEGRLVATIDALGHRAEVAHDLNAQRETVTNRVGYTMYYDYDSLGNVVLETYPGSPTVTIARSYDSRGNQLSETNELGETKTFTYDSRNLKLTETNALGETSRWTYSPFGDVATFTNAMGETSTTTYNSRGAVIGRTDPAGFTTTYQVDGHGMPFLEIDARGFYRWMSQDARFGVLVAEKNKRGVPTVNTFDDAGRMLTTTTTRSVGGQVEPLVSSYSYDAAGRVLTTTGPDGAVNATEYDPRGLVSARIDALGRRTELVYDAAGRQIATRYPDGTQESTTYDGEGRAVTRTDRAGRTRVMSYDDRGRMTGVTFDGATQSYGFDAAGRMVSMTDRRGHSSSSEFDAAGRLRTSTDALGHVTTRGYDAAGRVVSETDAKNRTRTMEYDARGLLLRTVYPDATETSSEYDESGHEIAKIDQEGRRTEYRYDGEGLLLGVTNPNGEAWSYGYDEQGQHVAQTDPLGHTTTMTYDAVGRETSRRFAIGPADQKTYDLAGNLVEKRSRMGFVTSYLYDAANRLTTRIQPDDLVQQTWSATGQRLTATNVAGTMSYAYDAHDRLSRQTDVHGYVLDYGRDANGNVTSMTAQVGSTSWTETYGIDALNRITSVSTDGVTYELEYDATGQLAELRYPSGLVTRYEYDALDRVTLIETRSAADQVVLSFAYARTPTGNIAMVTEADGLTHEYTYALADRLTQDLVRTSTGVVYVEGFQYDAAGNRTLRYYSEGVGAPELTYSSYDERDRLISSASETLAWDEDGRTLGRSGAEGYSIGWSSQDELLEFHRADGSVLTNTYDGDGVRVGFSNAPSGAGATQLLADGSSGLSQVIGESDAAGQLAARYIRVGGRLLGVAYTGARQDVLGDHLGSTRALVAESGGVTGEWAYRAFGAVHAHTGISPLRHLFAGEEVERGVSFNRARWLSQSEGRFLSADQTSRPLANWADRGPYSYAGGRPNLEVDPTGYYSQAETSAALAGQGDVLASSLLNVGAYLGARAISAAAVCAANYGASYVAHTELGADLPGPCSGKFPNRLRVQLQHANRAGMTDHTIGIPLAAPDPGVSVRATQSALDVLYTRSAPAERWFPESMMRSLYSAIVRLSARLETYPPDGVRGRRTTFDQELLGQGYRIDADNLAGWNLRTLR